MFEKTFRILYIALRVPLLKIVNNGIKAGRLAAEMAMFCSRLVKKLYIKYCSVEE